jgi:hypothetical protein
MMSAVRADTPLYRIEGVVGALVKGAHPDVWLEAFELCGKVCGSETSELGTLLHATQL